jgi:putative DNA primase/helicase
MGDAVSTEQDTRFPLTDAGNAERFAARYAGEVRFVHGPDHWLVWDGKRWAYDMLREAQRRAKDSARGIRLEAQLASDEKAAAHIFKHALRSERRQAIDSALSLARSEPPLAVAADELDADADLLCVENGTLDLRTGELLPHRQESLITKLAPVAFDRTAMAPTWTAFLERVMPDPALRDFLQRAVGYSMTGGVSEHTLFFLHGGGRNGKSTFLETMLALLGEYAKAAPHNLLLSSKQDRHSAEIATLMGFRFVTAVEAGEGRAWDEAKVKHLTGGDTVSARWMYGNPFTFTPSHKFWVAANHKPRVSGTDVGIWRRLHLIPWNVTIPEEEQDKDLLVKLRAELPGILAWAVAGCVAWRTSGLRPPTPVLEATRAYRSAEDVIGAFLDDCTTPGRKVLVGALYEEFSRWAQSGGEKSMSKRAFVEALESRGIHHKKSNGRVWVYGIALLALVSTAGSDDSEHRDAA